MLLLTFKRNDKALSFGIKLSPKIFPQLHKYPMLLLDTKTKKTVFTRAYCGEWLNFYFWYADLKGA